MTRAQHREQIPVTSEESAILDRLLNHSSAEYKALKQLVPGTAIKATSRAALAHHVLEIGMNALREAVQEEGYALLAASYTPEERAERRADVHSRRARLMATRGEE